MQWSAERNAGFSTAASARLAAPVVNHGPFAFAQLNVAAQQADDRSLLSRCRRILRARANLAEVGEGQWQILESGHPAVFAIVHRAQSCTVMLCNLSDKPVSLDDTLDIVLQDYEPILADRKYAAPDRGNLALAGFGYRWFRWRPSEL